MTQKKVLSATLSEALARKQPFLSLLSDQRPAPPSSRPPRSSELPPRRVHALSPPEGPDRSLVDAAPAPSAPEEAPMPKGKPKKKGPHAYDKGTKSLAVSRLRAIRKARDAGETPSESVADLSKELGVTETTLYNWAKIKDGPRRGWAKKTRKAAATEPTLVSAAPPKAPRPAPAAGIEAALETLVERVVQRILREKLGGS